MKLKDIRREKKLRAADIASRIGISQGHYSRLERGKRAMRDDMMAKIADILGQPKEVVQSSVDTNQLEVLTLKSWLSNIRINGLPFIKAFRYHLQSSEKDAASMDDTELKKELRLFIENNISYSVLAELSEKKELIANIRSKIYAADEILKDRKDNHEQLQGTN